MRFRLVQSVSVVIFETERSQLEKPAATIAAFYSNYLQRVWHHISMLSHENEAHYVLFQYKLM